jgi:hypothetical protein
MCFSHLPCAATRLGIAPKFMRFIILTRAQVIHINVSAERRHQRRTVPLLLRVLLFVLTLLTLLQLMPPLMLAGH